MDHVPYPLTSDLPALEIPLLGQPVPVHPLYSEGAAPSKLQKTEPDSLAIKSNHVDPITGEADLSTGDTQGSPRYPIVEASAQIPVQARQTTEDWTIAFWRYPKQHGWLSNDSKSRWFLCSEKEAAVRAQEWLYFRLLNEFLGVHVPAHTLSKPSTINGKIVVDSSTLPQLLHDWHLRIQQRGLGRKHDATEEYFSQDKAHRVISLLKSVLEECSNLDEQVEPFRSVSLSINILVETLAKAVWRITKDATAAQWKIWKLGPQPLLEERMARAGWCRFRISKIWYQYHPSTVYYLSSLPHRTTFGGYPHPACTADQCTFVGVDPVTYEPRHHKDCLTQSRCHRRCSMIGVNTAKIADIIIQGSIPLIEIQVQADDGVVLNVVPYKSSLRYVAISHVWSGGLGNVRANAMRSCQLRYLHNLLRHLRDNGDDDLDRRQGPRKIQDSVDDIRYKCGFERKRMPLYLWIDTLCVPIGPIHKEAYSKTLYRMAQLYVAAQCVLVLDPELQSIDHRVLQKEQTFTHIMCSSWMSRSWTFQEACMARIWFVQFADGYFTVDKQYFEFQKASGRLDQKEADVEAVISSPLPAVVDMSEPQIDLMHDVTHWFREMPVVAKIRNRDPRKLMNKLEDWKNLAFAWNGLRSRSTTKADDFYGIVAVVVDLSAGEVLKHQPEDRLKAILRSQTTLPLALLYQSGPRILDDKGYDTWAPARINGARLDVQSGYFTLRSSDLLLEPGQWPQLRAPQAILFTSLSTSSRLVNVEFDLTKTTRTIEFLLRPTSPLPDTPFSNVLCMFDDTLATILPGVGICAPGACLVIHSQEDMIYQASYLCPIRVFAPKTFTSYVDSSVSEKIEAEPAILSGSVLDWQKYSIVITSSALASWPSPTPHVSKRSASKRVIIRNASVWCQLSYNTIVQGPYLIAFGVFFAHRSDATSRRLSWFLLSRWLGIITESIWEGVVLVVWDHRRAVRWSDRLYGTFAKSGVRQIKDIGQYPVLIAKILLLAAALALIGMYCTYGESWMKVSGIVLFCDVGISSAYISLLIYLAFKYAKGQYRPFTLNVFTELPEDPFETSDSTLRFWEEETRPDVDHRYPIAIVAWRIVNYFRQKRRTNGTNDRSVTDT